MNQFLKTEVEITAWLEHMEIKGYELKEDAHYGYVVDANEINLSFKKLVHIPVKFDTIEEDFSCQYNRLQNLHFAPRHVGENFDFRHNFIQSLKGAPITVGHNFIGQYNRLTSLRHSPQMVGGYFSCANNIIRSLKGCPERVGGNFWCDSNKIENLDDCPKSVGGCFVAFDNPQLGSIQDLREFDAILKIQQEIITIQQEKNNFDQLVFTKSKKTLSTHKI